MGFKGSRLFYTVVLSATVALGLLCSLADAQGGGPRRWSGQERGRYYYGYQNRHYYYGSYWGANKDHYLYYYMYKPTGNAPQYHYHTVHYYPRNSGKYGGYYYYKYKGKPVPGRDESPDGNADGQQDDQTDLFWGRCQPNATTYYTLPKEARKKTLDEIDMGVFQDEKNGKPIGQTRVPGMNPGESIIPPPTPTTPPDEEPEFSFRRRLTIPLFDLLPNAQ